MRWVRNVAFIAAGLGAWGAGSAGSEAAGMAQYRWTNRPLVVFAPAQADARLRLQRADVASNKAGFSERDMVVIYVIGDQVVADLGPAPGLSARALRQRYGVGTEDFRAILVGKDGGAKRTSPEPLTAKVLFATIDAMPMRRDEVRRR